MRILYTMLLVLVIPLHIAAQDTIPARKSFPKKIADGVVGILTEFNNVDTSYIEPQHYKFSTMAQSTYFFERYEVTSKTGQSITFSPETRIKVGPYFGWSLLFLGYTIDLAYISANKKRELDLSLYSSLLGIDLFYRRSGHEYSITEVDFGDSSREPLEVDIPFNGLNVSITGLNAYYILNHHKFSYPAAFSQSTCQRRSAGSVILGAGYTRHFLSLDPKKLIESITPYYDEQDFTIYKYLPDADIHYTDVSLSGGYAYNWVFSRNWLFNVTLSAAIAYKHSTGNFIMDAFNFKDFSFSNFNFDGVGRFALVWNNSKWYFGSNAVVHSYNYRKSQFSTSNYFGNVNVYIGFNFGRKKNH